MRKMKWFLIAPIALVAMVFFAFLGGGIVMLLWNWLVPALFGWHTLTFWQALALLALCRILFGRWGGHGMARSNARRRMKDRWQSMTPEERERMRARCGFAPPEPTETPSGDV